MNQMLDALRGGLQASRLDIAKRFAQRVKDENASYDGTKVLTTFTHFSNKVVVSLTNQTFFDESFPKDEHFLIVGLRALSGANATLAATAWNPGISDALTLNGTFSLNNNGTDILKDQRLTLFVTAAATGEQNHKAGFIYLIRPIMWLAQTKLKITCNWGTAPTTANQNLSFEVFGIKLI